MAEAMNPLGFARDMQRSWLEQGRRGTHASIDLQRRMVGSLSRSFASQAEVERESLDLFEHLISLSVAGWRASVPGAEDELSELGAQMEENVAAWEGLFDEVRPSFTDLVDDSATTFDAFARTYLTLLDRSFDSALVANDRLFENLAGEEPIGGKPVQIDIEEGES